MKTHIENLKPPKVHLIPNSASKIMTSKASDLHHELEKNVLAKREEMPAKYSYLFCDKSEPHYVDAQKKLKRIIRQATNAYFAFHAINSASEFKQQTQMNEKFYVLITTPAVLDPVTCANGKWRPVNIANLQVYVSYFEGLTLAEFLDLGSLSFQQVLNYVQQEQVMPLNEQDLNRDKIRARLRKKAADFEASLNIDF